MNNLSSTSNIWPNYPAIALDPRWLHPPPNQDLVVQRTQWCQTCSHYWGASKVWLLGLCSFLSHFIRGISKQCCSKINKLKVNNPLLNSPIRSNLITSNRTVKTPTESSPTVKNPRANNIKASNPEAINPRAIYFGIVEYIIYNEFAIDY